MTARLTLGVGHIQFDSEGLKRYDVAMLLIDDIRKKIALRQYEFSKHAVDQAIIRGFIIEGRPLHVQCSYPSHPLVKIVTVYEPDPNLWLGFRLRKTD